MITDTNVENCKCFVPYCGNKRFMAEKSIRFFRVPDGIEGLCWKKAVNVCRKRQYERMIELLKTNRQLKLKSQLTQVEHCCEMHFNIENDIERIVEQDGSIEYRVKSGSVPSIQAIQGKSICEVDFDQLHNNKIPVEVSNHSSKNHYVSLVDISSFTRNAKREPDHQQIDIKLERLEPMTPLTIALMKRKSLLYTGLQQSRLARLLFIVAQQTTLTELMLMLTLRKLRLDEDFEVLGDMFDVDETTAKQHFDESRNLVLELSQSLQNEPTNFITTANVLDSTSNPIKLEPMDFGNEYIDECENEWKVREGDGEEKEDKPDVEEDEVEETESDTDTESDSTTSDRGGYKGQIDSDPDFESKSLSTESSEHYSDSEESSEMSTDDSTTEKVNCPYCDRTVIRLESHIHRIHLNPQNIGKTICGLCLKTFSNQLVLRQHQKEYHDGNAYSCDICGAMTTGFERLKKHISVKHHTVKDFLCHVCGDGFPFQHKLQEHVKKKHLMLRTKACTLCDKRYFTPSCLQAHINSAHTGERPYSCEECGKAFARRSSLQQHKQVHKEAKYACDVCDKKFGFTYNLKTHRKNVHGILV